MKGKRILITGGAGFIANKLISRIVDDNKIVVYDNFLRDTLTGSPLSGHPNIKVVTGDVLDCYLLEGIMEGADIVVHAAAIAGVDSVINNPVETMDVNIVGTSNVMWAANLNKVKDRVINFSTSEVFGSMAYKSCEDSGTTLGSAGEARWVYAASKVAGEHLAAAYYRQYNLPTVSVRPFNVYGAGQTGESALTIFIRRALKGQDIVIHGEGNQIRSWCYVDDFIDGLMSCLVEEKAIGQSFNIGNAKTVITVYGLAQAVLKVLGSRSKIVFVPPLSADVELRIPSVDKAEKILGFKAWRDLDYGIQKTAEWISGLG